MQFLVVFLVLAAVSYFFLFKSVEVINMHMYFLQLIFNAEAYYRRSYYNNYYPRYNSGLYGGGIYGNRGYYGNHYGNRGLYYGGGHHYYNNYSPYYGNGLSIARRTVYY